MAEAGGERLRAVAGVGGDRPGGEPREPADKRPRRRAAGGPADGGLSPLRTQHFLQRLVARPLAEVSISSQCLKSHFFLYNFSSCLYFLQGSNFYTKN